MDSASDVRASKMFIRYEVQRSWLENPSAVEKLNSTGVLIVAENTEIRLVSREGAASLIRNRNTTVWAESHEPDPDKEKKHAGKHCPPTRMNQGGGLSAEDTRFELVRA